MDKMDRRSFMKRAAAGVGAVGLTMKANGTDILNAADKKYAANDRVKLGKTDIEASRMAVGSGTVGWNKESNQTRLGMEKFTSLIRHGFERGITLWDAADMYGSHPYFKNALNHVDREKVTILTKSVSRDVPGMKKDIERFRKELGTDYIDILLMHCLMKDDWTNTMQAAMDVMSKAKEDGIVRAVGVSCHTLGALKAAVKTPWTDVILARINHAGKRMDGSPEEVVPVLREGHKAGKSILGMKITGQGDLRRQVDTSLKFMFKQGFVDAFTIGFESQSEMNDMIERVSKA